MPRLIGLRAPVLGLTVDLTEAETTLGREAGNSVMLHSASVSRRHARIVRQGAGFAVEDLGSANGVKVNGIPTVGQTPLKNGDRIDIGEVSLMYDDPAASAPATARKPEVGSAERSAVYQPPGADSALGGCSPFGNLLNDLSGALPGIMRYVIPVLLGLLALFCLFSLLMTGVAAIQGLMHGCGGGSGSPAGNGQQGPGANGGQQPPPSNSNSAGQGSSGQGSSGEGGSVKISILSTRVVPLAGGKGQLYVKWRNDSDQPVNELDGTVILHMPDGHQDSYPNTVLYKGAPVPPGQTHEDASTSEGASIASDADPSPAVLPTEVK